MKNLIKYTIVIFIFTLFYNHLYLYSYTNKADSLYKLGINLMNQKNFEKAINVFSEAKQFQPDNIIFDYEIALANYKLENYEKTIAILKNLKHHKDSFEQIYQLLGNSYDFLAKKDKAINIYNEGLNQFPNSGRLYMELGIAEIGRDNNELAIKYFDKGIYVQPDYANNYYHLAKVFYEEKYLIFSMIYAEASLNILRNENKFREINKLLYDIYNEIFIFEDDSIKLYTKVRYKRDKFTSKFREILSKSYKKSFNKFIDTLSINELHKLRVTFLELWFEESTTENSIITQRQKKLLDQNLFECYNYWIFSEGNIAETKIWLEENYSEFKELIKWLQNNKLRVSSSLDLFPKY